MDRRNGHGPSPGKGRRVLRAALIVFAIMALTAAADAAEWVTTKVQGTVIRLVGDRWLELSTGEPVSNGQAVRTLQSGRVELDLDGLHISLSRNTVMMVTGDTQSGGAQLHQYSGQVAITGNSGQRYTVTTPDLVVAGSGSTIVSVGDGLSRVQVVEGEAQIVDASGRKIALQAGDVGISGGGDPVVISAVVDTGVAVSGQVDGSGPIVVSAEQPTGDEHPTTGSTTGGNGASTTAASGGSTNGEAGSQNGANNGNTGTDNGNSESAGGSTGNGDSTGNNGNSNNAGGNGNSNGNAGNNGNGNGGNSQSTGDNANENNGKSSEAAAKGTGPKK